MSRVVKQALVVPVVLAAVLAVGGCGGGSDSTAAGGGAEVKRAEAAVQELIKGTYGTPPKGPRPEPGKELLLVSCGQSIPTCAAAMAGAGDAARTMGWSTQVFDTQADPSQAAAGIRQAIVSKADGVFVYFTDCRFMSQALREAAEAGIPVVAAESLDCDYRSSGEPLFAATVRYEEGSYAEWISAYGKAQAEYLIAAEGGEAKTVMYVEEGLFGAEIQQAAIAKTLGECSGCSIYEVPYTIGDLTTGLQQKTEQALLQNPDANAAVVDYDAVLLAGVSTGVQTANREITVMAAEGNEATLDLVRKGTVAAGIGIPVEWEGYAGVDALNRIFHGDPVVTSGIGLQIYDAENNLPASGTYQPPIDFRAAYEKAWGLAG